LFYPQLECVLKNVKTFVIDTNIFIHKHDAIYSFRDNEIVIPLTVLEELDRLKSYSDERGRNAREAIRFLDGISKHGDINKGIKMDNGSLLRVELHYDKTIPIDIDLEKNDNKILLTAYKLQREGKHVFFVSKDINARIKATAMGIKAVDYEKQKVDINALYTGVREVDISAETMNVLKKKGYIEWHDEFTPNEFVVLNQKDVSATEFAQYDGGRRELRYVKSSSLSVCGIKPLNERQRMVLEILLDDSVTLATIMGKAGTGKTLLAIAAGLHKVLEEKKYSRVMVSRPVIPLGKDIGYLPGAKSEKLSHWMQPLFDNLEYILSVYKSQSIKSMEQLLSNNMIELEALSHIRGRSLPSQFIIIDEAQNLSPHEIKTIVSRAGENSKMVLTGDPYQIDSPYLDANSNGLTYLVDAFKGQSLFGHVTLLKSERSDLAELAAELL
jgi:PhoH-like ATPase